MPGDRSGGGAWQSRQRFGLRGPCPAFRGMPTDAATVTYANADLTETIKVFEQYGVRLLTPNEIRAEIPLYAREFTVSDQAALALQ